MSDSIEKDLMEMEEVLWAFGYQKYQWRDGVPDDVVVVDNRESMITVGTYRSAYNAAINCTDLLKRVKKLKGLL